MSLLLTVFRAPSEESKVKEERLDSNGLLINFARDRNSAVVVFL